MICAVSVKPTAFSDKDLVVANLEDDRYSLH